MITRLGTTKCDTKLLTNKLVTITTVMLLFGIASGQQVFLSIMVRRYGESDPSISKVMSKQMALKNMIVVGLVCFVILEAWQVMHGLSVPYRVQMSAVHYLYFKYR